MSSAEIHTKHALHNTNFLETFYKKYEYNDWAITVSFYIAIHLIEQGIFKKETISYQGKKFQISHSEQLLQIIKCPDITPLKNRPGDLSHHTMRNLIVNENFSEISKVFKSLYQESRTARYKQFHYEKIQVEILIKQELREIINWSNKNFGTNLTLNL